MRPKRPILAVGAAIARRDREGLRSPSPRRRGRPASRRRRDEWSSPSRSIDRSCGSTPQKSRCAWLRNTHLPVLVAHPQHRRRILRHRPAEFLARIEIGDLVAPGRDVLDGAAHDASLIGSLADSRHFDETAIPEADGHSQLVETAYRFHEARRVHFVQEVAECRARPDLAPQQIHATRRNSASLPRQIGS